MRVRDERTEMADVTRQKAAETDAQPQAEVRHQIPEETDTPMEGKTQELRQDAPVYPEAEYDDYEDEQEDWDASDEESPQESDEDYREPEEPYYDDDYLMIPEHLRGLFSGFTEIPELEDQIANAIIQAQSKGDDRTSKSGNILIFGAHGSGKTTLAMNLAYNGNSAIPVKFVFQLAAPTYFAPSEWSLLMKVDRLDSEEKFCKMMTGKELEDYDTEIQNISPACIVNEDSVPSLIGYGLIDHCVPLSQKYYLIEVYDRDNVMYDYIEFPKSNHGMYNDLDKLQEFLDKSLEYARVYFTN